MAIKYFLTHSGGSNHQIFDPPSQMWHIFQVGSLQVEASPSFAVCPKKKLEQNTLWKFKKIYVPQISVKTSFAKINFQNSSFCVTLNLLHIWFHVKLSVWKILRFPLCKQGRGFVQDCSCSFFSVSYPYFLISVLNFPPFLLLKSLMCS